MMGEGTRGTHSGNKRRWRHILGQPWRKYHSNIGGGDGVRGTYSRVRGGNIGGRREGIRR